MARKDAPLVTFDARALISFFSSFGLLSASFSFDIYAVQKNAGVFIVVFFADVKLLVLIRLPLSL